MGLEAECSCRWSGGAAPVKALLESRELILRGGPRRTLPFATIQSAAIDGDGLVLTTADETYRLDLGAARAARWKTRIETPPPTLKDKLGLRDGATAFVIGAVEDAALAEALEGADGPAAANICIAEAASEAALTAALEVYDREGAGRPLWIVHGMGPGAALGDNAVRAVMRARGFIDSKACAVSAARSATRYAPR